MTIVLLGISSPLRADTLMVAVASNFSMPMKEIATAFEQESGHRLNVAFAASGKLYAQIVNGAPFQVFLSADRDKPARLEQEGLAKPGSRFTYATGALILWSATPGFVDPEGLVLQSNTFDHLALPSPKLAPYGAAAKEVLENLGLFAGLSNKLVAGENIAQTYQFVASGNAELGFVARSQVMKSDQLINGSAWLVPVELHGPIRQDAILLARGEGNAGAEALMSYLRSDKAKAIITSYGYLW